MVNLKEYFTNLGHALIGSSMTGFLDASGSTLGETTVYSVGYLDSLAIFAFLWLVLGIFLIVCNLYGAVRLSWCYNTYLGTSPGLKVVYAVLCFFFPVFYYPFYGVFLDPLCGITKNMKGRNVKA